MAIKYRRTDILKKYPVDLCTQNREFTCPDRAPM